jgi:hypothetical protein
MGMKNVQGVIPPAIAVSNATANIARPAAQNSNRQQHQGNSSSWTRGGNQSSYRGATSNKSNFPPMVNAIGVEKTGSNKCGVCKEEPGHALERCNQFMELSIDYRAKAVFDLNNCFRCLGRNHISRECKKSLRCEEQDCNRASHHTLIHRVTRVAPNSQKRQHPQNQP